jgi:hypothetical protein
LPLLPQPQPPKLRFNKLLPSGKTITNLLLFPLSPSCVILTLGASDVVVRNLPPRAVSGGSQALPRRQGNQRPFELDIVFHLSQQPHQLATIVFAGVTIRNLDPNRPLYEVF